MSLDVLEPIAAKLQRQTDDHHVLFAADEVTPLVNEITWLRSYLVDVQMEQQGWTEAYSSRTDALRNALLRYGVHEVGCGALDGTFQGAPPPACGWSMYCTCGLSEMLNGGERKGETTAEERYPPGVVSAIIDPLDPPEKKRRQRSNKKEASA